MATVWVHGNGVWVHTMVPGAHLLAIEDGGERGPGDHDLPVRAWHLAGDGENEDWGVGKLEFY